MAAIFGQGTAVSPPAFGSVVVCFCRLTLEQLSTAVQSATEAAFDTSDPPQSLVSSSGISGWPLPGAVAFPDLLRKSVTRNFLQFAGVQILEPLKRILPALVRTFLLLAQVPRVCDC